MHTTQVHAGDRHESQQHLSHSSISTNGIFVFKDIGLS